MSDASHRAADRIHRRLPDLSRHLIAFWLSHGVDEENGGFFGSLNRQGEPGPPWDKSVIQQARHLWALSTWYSRRGRHPEHAAVARRTYQLIIEGFLDPKDDEFRFTISPDGTVLDATKILYAQGFAIYGLSAYGHVFGDDNAIEHALKCFSAIDSRAHDGANGGYDESNDPPWLTNGGDKDTNTHIHLMEAFSVLYRVTADPRVKERLEELMRLVATRMFQPEGYVHTQFAMDWTPVGTPAVSYGHDIETAWLLLDAEAALGAREPAVEQAAIAMGRNACREGFDEILGGFFDHGQPGKGILSREKVWWAQFEGLAGLWWLFRLTRDPIHLDRLSKTLDWIEGPGRDATHGEWYWGVMPDGSVGPFGERKGDPWKTMYHNLRALVLTEDWIAHWLDQFS